MHSKSKAEKAGGTLFAQPRFAVLAGTPWVWLMSRAIAHRLVKRSVGRWVESDYG